MPLVVGESPCTGLWGGPMPIQTEEAAGPGGPPQSLHFVLRTRQGARGWDPKEEQAGLRREVQPMPLQPELMGETVLAFREPPACRKRGHTSRSLTM